MHIRGANRVSIIFLTLLAGPSCRQVVVKTAIPKSEILAAAAAASKTSSSPTPSPSASVSPQPNPAPSNDPSGIVPANQVLVIYNTNVTDSARVKDYYLSHRPGMAGANVLGVAAAAGTDGGPVIDVDSYQINDTILKPLAAWLAANPSKAIKYIVLIYGMPFNDSFYVLNGGNGGSVDYYLTKGSTWDQVLKGNLGTEFFQVDDTYDHSKYAGTVALVGRVDMGSADATMAYIDKLAAMYALMPQKSVVISAQASGSAGSNYYFDDLGIYPTWKPALWSKNILAQILSQNIFYSDPPAQNPPRPFQSGNDVAGMMHWGNYGLSSGDYPTDGEIKLTGKSNWWLTETVESFNGRFDTGQGSFKKWFSASAFGGTVYSNTPVGAVAHTAEPCVGGVHTGLFFKMWEEGRLLSEAGWASRSTVKCNTGAPNGSVIVVGDPLIKK